ncbi:MAG: ABC transporter permease [Chloroflexi bacterium]|nr:ABC transporter permease [Chloroflexota bacterium]MCI0879136.1 ABC transporter permease [Chloroflexota bacterium]
MQKYILNRFLQSIIVLFIVGLIVFALGRATGNPAELMVPDDATEEEILFVEHALGLDRPYHIQLYIFMINAIRGDFGESLVYKQPARDMFFDRLPNTLKLMPLSMAIAVGVAIPLGVLAAIRRGTWIDNLAGGIAVFGVATPNFWLAIVGIYIFSVWLDVLPPGRMGGPSHYIMPAITLGTFSIAGMMRLIRSSMLEVLDTEYVKLARIKGLPEWKVFWKHALRNALIPVLTLFGVFVGGFVTGAIVTETVFAWPGIGRLTIDAVAQRDFPLLQAVILMDAVIILFVNLMVDILYAYVNPRIRLT